MRSGIQMVRCFGNSEQGIVVGCSALELCAVVSPCIEGETNVLSLAPKNFMWSIHPSFW